MWLQGWKIQQHVKVDVPDWHMSVTCQNKHTVSQTLVMRRSVMIWFCHIFKVFSSCRALFPFLSFSLRAFSQFLGWCDDDCTFTYCTYFFFSLVYLSLCCFLKFSVCTVSFYNFEKDPKEKTTREQDIETRSELWKQKANTKVQKQGQHVEGNPKTFESIRKPNWTTNWPDTRYTGKEQMQERKTDAELKLVNTNILLNHYDCQSTLSNP